MADDPDFGVATQPVPPAVCSHPVLWLLTLLTATVPPTFKTLFGVRLGWVMLNIVPSTFMDRDLSRRLSCCLRWSSCSSSCLRCGGEDTHRVRCLRRSASRRDPRRNRASARDGPIEEYVSTGQNSNCEIEWQRSPTMGLRTLKRFSCRCLWMTCGR